MVQLKLPLGATFAPALTRLTTPLGGEHTLAIHLDLEALSPKTQSSRFCLGFNGALMINMSF